MPTTFSAPLTIEINESLETLPIEIGDVDKSTSTSFVQTILVDNARQNQLDVGQIIENNSGIKIRRTGGIGSYSSVSIRGKSSDQVMVYMDGMLLNNASGGSVDLSQIPLDQVAQIEIYKDAIPVEFSEASNGGVINIITHREKERTRSRVNTNIGSFGTFNLGLNNAVQYKRWNLVLSGNFLTSNNDYAFIHDAGTPNKTSDDYIDTRKNNSLDQKNILLKAKQNIDDNRSINYRFEWFDKTKEIPSLSNLSATSTKLIYNNRLLNVKYEHHEFLLNDLSLNLSVGFNDKSTIFDDSANNIGLQSTRLHMDTHTASSKLYLSYRKQHYRLINNVQFRFESINNRDELNNTNSRSNTRKTISNASQVDFYFYNKKIIISPAGRLFFTHDDFSGDTLLEGNDQNQINNLTKTYHTFSKQIGIRYQAWNALIFKLNVAQYFRLPTYVELFGTRGYIGSSDTLKPEKGNNYDVGFESTLHPKSIVLTKFNWNFTLFHSIIEDEISYSFNAQSIGHPSNNRMSVITGVENNLTLELFYDIEFQSNTTYQLPENRSDKNKIKHLSGRPILSQLTRISAHHNEFNFFFEHVYESAYYYDSDERLLGKDKSLFNAGVNITSNKLNFIFSVNNIFDHKNQDYYKQVSPGLSIFLSTTFHLN